MNLNYTFLSTGVYDKAANYYISCLLYDVIGDTESELLDIALRSTSWDWDKWFYVPEDVLCRLDEPALEKLRSNVTQGLFHVVANHEDLLWYLRDIGQDRRLTDYLHFSPKRRGVMVFYPHVVEYRGEFNESNNLYSKVY